MQSGGLIKSGVDGTKRGCSALSSHPDLTSDPNGLSAEISAKCFEKLTVFAPAFHDVVNAMERVGGVGARSIAQKLPIKKRDSQQRPCFRKYSEYVGGSKLPGHSRGFQFECFLARSSHGSGVTQSARYVPWSSLVRADDCQQSRAHAGLDLGPSFNDFLHLFHPSLQFRVNFRRFFGVCNSLCTGLREAVVSLIAQARLQNCAQQFESLRPLHFKKASCDVTGRFFVPSAVIFQRLQSAASCPESTSGVCHDLGRPPFVHAFRRIPPWVA